MFNGESRYEEEEDSHEKEPTWDDALRKGTQEYQHHSYNIFTCNCHSFVANNLNRLAVRSGGWNVVNLAALVFFKGTLGEQNGYDKVLVASSHSLRSRNLTGWLDFHSFLLDSSGFAYRLVHHGNVLFRETDPAVDLD